MERLRGDSPLVGSVGCAMASVLTGALSSALKQMRCCCIGNLCPTERHIHAPKWKAHALDHHRDRPTPYRGRS